MHSHPQNNGQHHVHATSNELRSENLRLRCQNRFGCSLHRRLRLRLRRRLCLGYRHIGKYVVWFKEIQRGGGIEGASTNHVLSSLKKHWRAIQVSLSIALSKYNTLNGTPATKYEDVSREGLLLLRASSTYLGFCVCILADPSSVPISRDACVNKMWNMVNDTVNWKSAHDAAKIISRASLPTLRERWSRRPACSDKRDQHRKKKTKQTQGRRTARSSKYCKVACVRRDT